MKLFKTLSALCMAAVVAVAVSACAPTAKSEGTGGYIDDTVVTTKVKSALLADKTSSRARSAWKPLKDAFS